MEAIGKLYANPDSLMPRGLSHQEVRNSIVTHNKTSNTFNNEFKVTVHASGNPFEVERAVQLALKNYAESLNR